MSTFWSAEDAHCNNFVHLANDHDTFYGYDAAAAAAIAALGLNRRRTQRARAPACRAITQTVARCLDLDNYETASTLTVKSVSMEADKRLSRRGVRGLRVGRAWGERCCCSACARVDVKGGRGRRLLRGSAAEARAQRWRARDGGPTVLSLRLLSLRQAQDPRLRLSEESSLSNIFRIG